MNCIYLYVGLKAGSNGCWEKKIFEQLKKCIMLKLNSIVKMKTNPHILENLTNVGIFISMFI